ncbi:MAG: toxic anion resistance protein, partial [Carnobacterium sp.]
MTDNNPTNNDSLTKVNSELDELLSNPFDDASLNAPSIKESPEKDLIETQKVDRLINRLPEERQKQARELAEQIDVTNIQSVMSYGAAAQQKLGEFSHAMLNQVQNQDTGEIGDSLNDLMFRLNEANPEELRADDNNVFKKIFGRVRKSIYEMTAKYQKIGAQIDKISIKLDKEKSGLINDNIMLEQLYQKNKDYFDALNIYIAAGELKIDELSNTVIPES